MAVVCLLCCHILCLFGSGLSATVTKVYCIVLLYKKNSTKQHYQKSMPDDKSKQGKAKLMQFDTAIQQTWRLPIYRENKNK